MRAAVEPRAVTEPEPTAVEPTATTHVHLPNGTVVSVPSDDPRVLISQSDVRRR